MSRFGYARDAYRGAGRRRQRKLSFTVEELAPVDDVPVEASTPAVTRAMLSPDQVVVYDQILAWLRDKRRRQYLTFGGYAGTGKTTLIAALASAPEIENLVVAYAAYTGKAANVLQQKLRAAGIRGAHCGTLHSLIYRPETDPVTGKVVEWCLVPEAPADLVILDEASMIGADIWSDLLSLGIPILAVGDHGQLPPIGRDATNLMTKPDLRLEKIHRQAEGNPILALAHHVRGGGSVRQFKADGDRVRYARTFPSVAERFLAGDVADTAALSYFNRTRIALNAQVRKMRGFEGPMPDPGDVVVCLRNASPIFNGMRGVLEGADYANSDDNGLFDAVVTFPDDNLRLKGKLNSHQFSREGTFDDLQQIPGQPKNWNDAGLLFDFGYALTCHKAQGSAFREVGIMLEGRFDGDEDKRIRWLYTAITRAVERVYIIG